MLEFLTHRRFEGLSAAANPMPPDNPKNMPVHMPSAKKNTKLKSVTNDKPKIWNNKYDW